MNAKLRFRNLNCRRAWTGMRYTVRINDLQFRISRMQAQAATRPVIEGVVTSRTVRPR